MKSAGHEALEARLDLVVRLLAALAIEGKTKKDAINLLGSLGLDRNLIAAVVDTTPLAVSVTRSEAKKDRNNRHRAKPKQAGIPT